MLKIEWQLFTARVYNLKNSNTNDSFQGAFFVGKKFSRSLKYPKRVAN